MNELDGRIAAGQLDSNDKSRRALDLETEVTQAEKNGGATDSQKTEAADARAEAVIASKELAGWKQERIDLRTAKNTEVVVNNHMAKRANDESSSTEKAAEEARKTAADVKTATKIAMDKAEVDNKIAIDKAKSDANKAKEVFEKARLNKFSNPSKENETAYEKAKEDVKIADENIITITSQYTANITAVQDKNQRLIDNAEKLSSKKDAAAEKAKKIADELNAALISGKTVKRSINDLEFNDLPDIKHEISSKNSVIKNKYAEDIEGRWFNKKINKQAAHNIRMNSEIKSSGSH